MGKESDAKAILDGATGASRHDSNPNRGYWRQLPALGACSRSAAIPARWVLERSAWAEAAALRAEGERLSLHGSDDVLRVLTWRVAYRRFRKGKFGHRFPGVDSAAAEREG